MKLTKERLKGLAQIFFQEIWNWINEGDDHIYEVVDPECQYGDELCKKLNNETVLEVLKLGFKAKFGEELAIKED